MIEITASERAELAEQLGISEQYLYQCLTGRRDMNPLEASRVEKDTKGRLRRWDLCTRNWWLVWPELVTAKGAPRVPKQAA